MNQLCVCVCVHECTIETAFVFESFFSSMFKKKKKKMLLNVLLQNILNVLSK